MRSTFLFLTTISCLFFFYAVGYASPAMGEPIAIEIMAESSSGFTVALDFQTPELIVHRQTPGVVSLRVDLPGAMPEFETDGPMLPALSKLVAVPDGYTVRARIRNMDEVRYDLESYAGRDELSSRTLRQTTRPSIVEVGEPGWMRWLRVAPVVIRPASYEAEEHQIVCADRMEIEFEFVRKGEISGNSPDRQRYWSQAFEDYFRVSVLNYDSIHDFGFIFPGGRVVQRGSYLIFTVDAHVRYLQEFAEWKRRKGFDVVVEPIYRDGIQASEIKDYIQDAYDNWERPPEFILLAGDANASNYRMPTYHIDSPRFPDEDPNATDQPYVMLEGDDYFIDAFIGRISCDQPSPGDLQRALSRYIRHERDLLDLDGLDLEAFQRAVVFAGNYGEAGNILSPVETSRWLADRLREKDYEVAEFYWLKQGDDTNSGPIIDAINRGVNIVCYRGWADSRGTHYPRFRFEDLDRLRNDPLLPIFTFFVCNTGDFDNENYVKCFGEEAITCGQRNLPWGALVFFGPSDLHTQTRYNNPMLAGFYYSLLYQGLRVFGPLTLASKMEIWRGYPHERERGGIGDPGYVEFYTHVYNILGDPEVNLYFDAPFRLSVEHPDSLNVGDTYALFTVHDEDEGSVPGALVTLRKTDETEISVLTDGDGEALIPVQLDTEGELEVTVIARQAAPYLASIPVQTAERNVGLASVEIVDDEWDGCLPCGQPVDLMVTLRNTGSAAVAGVEAELTSLWEGIEISRDHASFGDIAANASAAGESPYTVELPPILPDSYTAPFILDITDASDNHYQALFRLGISAAGLRYQRYALEGGSISAGEEGNLTVTIWNIGSLDVTGVTASLNTFDNSVTIIDNEATFGDIAADEVVACSDDPFRIQVADNVTDGRQVGMRLALYDSEGRLVRRARFNITIGEVDAEDPIGPDAYGYYAYEDIDDHELAPDYEWIELHPDYGGEGAELHRLKDDSTFVMQLPFDFTFYGETYDSIAICSNGWVSFEITAKHYNFRNWGISSPLGPHSMIAPFWEDLVGERIGDNERDLLDVLTRYDEDEGRFIVEWSRVYARSSAEDYLETFELVLFNPEDHETPTGDGIILFQYLDVTVVDRGETNFVTVGIQDYVHERGLEITYANRYPAAAGRLADERAIKFTTEPPDDYLGALDDEPTQPLSFGLDEPYPNPFNTATRIGFNIPYSMNVRLALWDLNGRLIKELKVGETVAGHYIITLNLNTTPSGLYIIRLEAGGLSSQKKLIFIQ